MGFQYHETVQPGEDDQGSRNQDNESESPPSTPSRLSKRFHAATLQEAREKAIAFQAGLKGTVTGEQFYDTRGEVATGVDNTAERALDKATAELPAIAADIKSPETIEEHIGLVLEIRAQTERQAREQWKQRTHLVLDTLTCIVKPRGFLGFAKRPGVWKAEHAARYSVRIPYTRPAEVVLWYEENT